MNRETDTITQKSNIIKYNRKSSHTLGIRRKLCDNGIEGDNKDFILACYCGEINLVKSHLHKNIIDPTILDNYAIKCASKHGYIDIVIELLKHELVDPSADNNYAIYAAMEFGQTNVVELLFSDPRVNSTINYNVLFVKACAGGHSEVVKFLLANTNIDPSIDNNYPIRCASRRGDLTIVNLLLSDPRVNPYDYANDFHENSIRIALISKNDELIQLFLSNERTAEYTSQLLNKQNMQKNILLL